MVSWISAACFSFGQGWDAVPQYHAGCSVPGGDTLTPHLEALEEGGVLIKKKKKKDKLRHSYVSPVLKKV